MKKTLWMLGFALFSLVEQQSLAGALNDIDPAQSSYTCELFDSSDGTSHTKQVVYIPQHGKAVVSLADGVHTVNLTWFSWTLNLSIKPENQIREVVGAASHLHFKLRSHRPNVSIYCSNDEIAQ